MSTSPFYSFKKFEEYGRDRVIEFLSQFPGFSDFEPTEYQYDRIDMFCLYNGQKIAIEIKTRKAVYPEGQMIEESKIQALLSARQDRGASFSLYINVLPESIYIWKIDESIYELELKQDLFPSSTAKRTGLTWKLYRLLPLDRAIVDKNPF